MMHKTWNVRDQTEETLKILLKRKYKEINDNYEMLKKVSNIDEANKLVNEIWMMKSFASDIELELMRREYNNGTTS
jgi:predicted transport protein